MICHRGCLINLKEALFSINPTTLSHNDWIKVGMALKAAQVEGYDVSVNDFDEWSKLDSARYKEGDCQRRWNSFNSTGITKSTLIWMAIDNGFDPFKEEYLTWDSVIDDGVKKTNTDTIIFLKTLFKPEEIINFRLKSYEDGKPAGYGLNMPLNVAVENLENYTTIEEALEDYNHNNGGWIVINPTDGKGIKSENITDFRYCLIECDDIPLKDQLAFISRFKLPCVALIDSGKRSIHAVMRIEAHTRKEYDERVNKVYKILKDNGFPIDENNKNPNRMTRLPGLERGENTQKLIDINVGFKSYAEWIEFIENDFNEPELPAINSIHEVLKNPPEKSPEIIEGILRQGHKMMIAGASKAGKSFLLIQLADALATGDTWLGHECEKCKVLYLNFEIDDASFYDRVKKIADVKGYAYEDLIGFDVWNLRGFSQDTNKLTNKIINRAKDKDYSVIIIDPLYKFQQGDENSSETIKSFTNAIDRICRELNVAVIYCHHHSKGAQSGKNVADRASGSGVFARDVDALLDIVELSNAQFIGNENYEGVTSWQMNYVLREFKTPKPTNFYFKYPCHYLDEKGLLNNADFADCSTKIIQEKEQRKEQRKHIKTEAKFAQLFRAVKEVGINNVADTKAVVAKIGKAQRTLSDWNREIEQELGVKYFTISPTKITYIGD